MMLQVNYDLNKNYSSSRSYDHLLQSKYSYTDNSIYSKNYLLFFINVKRRRVVRYGSAV